MSAHARGVHPPAARGHRTPQSPWPGRAASRRDARRVLPPRGGARREVPASGQSVQHTFQTNGLLLDDEWCAFFKENAFLVGLSVDGPREMHDAYRLDRRGRGTSTASWRAAGPAPARVDFNILCTVNAANQAARAAVYRSCATSWRAVGAVHTVVERATEETLALANQAGATGRGGAAALHPVGSLVTERTVGGSSTAASWSTSSRVGAADVGGLRAAVQT